VVLWDEYKASGCDDVIAGIEYGNKPKKIVYKRPLPIHHL
jgi:hypothetical protein